MQRHLSDILKCVAVCIAEALFLCILLQELNVDCGRRPLKSVMERKLGYFGSVVRCSEL